jgi:hypothetical protein
MKIWPSKDPDEHLDYGFDWSPRALDGPILTTTCDVISGSVVCPAHGLAPDLSSTTTWLSGGMAGERCQLLLRITTATQTLDQTVYIDIKNR